MKNPERISRAQRMLCRAAMAHCDEKIRNARRTEAEIDRSLTALGMDVPALNERIAANKTRFAALIVHGKNCAKVAHDPQRNEYLHDATDDTPYSVDGVRYCGRCHYAL